MGNKKKKLMIPTESGSGGSSASKPSSFWDSFWSFGKKGSNVSRGIGGLSRAGQKGMDLWNKWDSNSTAKNTSLGMGVGAELLTSASNVTGAFANDKTEEGLTTQMAADGLGAAGSFLGAGAEIANLVDMSKKDFSKDTPTEEDSQMKKELKRADAVSGITDGLLGSITNIHDAKNKSGVDRASSGFSAASSIFKTAKGVSDLTGTFLGKDGSKIAKKVSGGMSIAGNAMDIGSGVANFAKAAKKGADGKRDKAGMVGAGSGIAASLFEAVSTGIGTFGDSKNKTLQMIGSGFKIASGLAKGIGSIAKIFGSKKKKDKLKAEKAGKVLPKIDDESTKTTNTTNVASGDEVNLKIPEVSNSSENTSPSESPASSNGTEAATDIPVIAEKKEESA